MSMGNYQPKTVEIFDGPVYDIFFLDLTSFNENEVVQIFNDCAVIASNTKRKFGLIINTKKVFVTPKMRQAGKVLTAELENTKRYIGATLYGVNTFIKLVAQLANPKVQFGNSFEECETLIQEMLDGKYDNHLPDGSSSLNSVK